jgi:hypothetical protein
MMNTIPHPEQKPVPKRIRGLLKKLHRLDMNPHSPASWSAYRKVLARDLNILTSRAVFELEVGPDGADTAFARAVVRVVERVREFEEI